MSHWTIMRTDCSVYRDGFAHAIDCSSIEPDIRVIHWDDVKHKGWIEYHNDADGNHRPNENITAIQPHHQSLIDTWDSANKEHDNHMDLLEKIHKSAADFDQAIKDGVQQNILKNMGNEYDAMRDKFLAQQKQRQEARVAMKRNVHAATGTFRSS